MDQNIQHVPVLRKNTKPIWRARVLHDHENGRLALKSTSWTFVTFLPAECVRVSFPSHHSGILLLLRALVVLQSHAGLVRGTCFDLLCQLGSACFSFQELFRVVPLQWNSGEDTKLWPNFDLLPINTFTYADKYPQKVKTMNLRICRQAAVVCWQDAVLLLIEFEHIIRVPSVWLMQRHRRQKSSFTNRSFSFQFCIVHNMQMFLLKNHPKMWWWITIRKIFTSIRLATTTRNLTNDVQCCAAVGYSYHIGIQRLQAVRVVGLPSLPRLQIFFLMFTINPVAHSCICEVVCSVYRSY